MVASTIFKMAVKAAAPKASKAVSKANETANVLKSLGTESDTLVDKKVLNKIETRKGIDLEYGDIGYGDIGESLDKARKFNILADKQIKKYNIDPDSIIKNEEGLPAVLYHKYSGGDKPFKLGKSKGNPEYREKELSKEIGEDVSFMNAPDNNDFLSTTTVPPSTNRFGSNFDNAAVFIGMGKVKKVFEYTDEKQVDELLKPFKESKHYNKLKENIQKGDWKFIELERIKDRLKELGYDAFTTKEHGKNVMLFNPEEQFIPLFNPLSKTDETASILKTLGKKESDISDFQTKYFRGDDKTRYSSEDLQKEAIKLDEGLIGLDDFIKARDEIKPLKTYGTVPPLNKQTDEAGEFISPDVFDPMEIVGPLGKGKVDKSGIIGINKNIKEGEKTTSRFDIDAYNMYDRYIAAIQTKVKDKFKLKGYSPTAVLTDVKFNYRPNQAFAIAQGKGKSPFATMEGNWKNLTPEETHKYANKKVGTKEWTEVGFDPAARLSFYNRATGEPVFNAEEVIQVGAMILARGIKKPTKKQLEKLNIKTKAGEVIRYKEGGQVMPMQYGGGLSNAYSTLSERRQNQNMYGMGEVPSQMSSVFQDPMEASAFSPVNMEQGGDIVVPTIYRQEGGGMDDDYTESDLADAGFDAGDFNFGVNSGNDTISRGVPSSEGQFIGSQVPSIPSSGDDKSDYVTDERYAELYGKSNTTTPSFDERTGEFIYSRVDPSGQVGPTGPTRQFYENQLNKEGFPEYTWGFYNDAKDRGMTNDEATAYVASIMAAPGGISRMQSGDFVYGAIQGTAEDILEKGFQSQYAGIVDILKQSKKNKEDSRELDLIDNPDLPLDRGFIGNIADKLGLSSIVDKITDAVTVTGKLDPLTEQQINNALPSGAKFTPNNAFAAGLVDLTAPLAGKAINYFTGGGQSVGTITTPEGVTFDVTNTGKVNVTGVGSSPNSTGVDLGLATIDDSGNDQPERRRVVQAAVPTPSPVKEDEELTGIKGLLARRKPVASRRDSNKFSELLLSNLYPNQNINLG